MSSFDSTINRNSFALQLEKHLDDVRKNRGNLSLDTGREVGRQNDAAADLLSRSDLRSSILYSTYQTGFTSYDQRARFQSGVFSVVDLQRQFLKNIA